MNSAYLWLLAACGALAALALWKPSTPFWRRQRILFMVLVVNGLVIGGGHVLALRLGYPEHAEIGVWKYFALASLFVFNALRRWRRVPQGHRWYLPPKTRRVVRAGFLVFGFVLLGLGMHRDREFVAVYRGCEALYAAARTPAERVATGNRVLDPNITAFGPSARNPGPALACRDILNP